MGKIAIVTVKNGVAECRDSNGNFVRYVGSNVKDARMQGGGFTVTQNNGQTALYDEDGNFKRYL